MHVLGYGAVMVGMGERSTPMAAELLASALFQRERFDRVVHLGATASAEPELFNLEN